ncbi:DHA2 family efflux MFS transporter permease subunit [Rudaeicoccus suwonensis]|uniref:EmrB/QacA subfamily drug resistance transporter n=1 Tax=Rudaeicoccus suwonensis TaxID=657409 RepID=A0A561E9B5_9MICO|nr:DHA2 family efflux MFS transporter permease subunit [Rudaeicoccus suwonensis]TWE12177.1 EmrB/QacA subfamily drug resistance transporter [Rudaeicoccus suwonensis]
MSTTDLELAPENGLTRPKSANLTVALIVIAMAQLMIVLDATIVNIALPHIKTDLTFSSSGLQWVVTAYSLSFGSLLLLGGRLGDLMGRRRMFAIGVAIFAVASLFGGLALNPAWLITGRVLQGAGAALASPAALALINTTFPAGKERNRAMAVYAAMSGIGAAVGLILGGVLTEWLDWRWTFFINVPIGLVVAVLAPRVLVESESSDGRLDVWGAIVGTAGLFSIVYGLSHAAQQGASWGDALTVLPLVAGVALLIAFVLVEQRVAHPLLPVRVVADRNRGVSLFTMMLVGAGMFSMFFFLSLFTQQVLGYSPVKSGFAFLPFSVGIVVSAGIASQLVSRIDPRWISGVGGVIATIGLWGFTNLSMSSGYASHLLPYIVILAVGLGMLFIPLTLTSTAGIGTEDSGAAASALNTAQQIGGAVGIAALTTVFTHYATQKGNELGAAAKAQAAAAAQSGHTPNKDQIAAATHQIQLQAQTFGSTHGFWFAAGMVLVGALATLVFLNVKHTELATDGQGAAHLG